MESNQTAVLNTYLCVLDALEHSEVRGRTWPHYILPDGSLVCLIRWLRNEKWELMVRVTNGTDRREYLDTWFDKNAIFVGDMERQFFKLVTVQGENHVG